MSETKKPLSAEQLLFDAACKCMSPDQMDKFEALQKSDAGFSLRFLNSILDQFGYEPAAHMVRHVNFRGDEKAWRNVEPAFLHQYRADRDYETRPVYATPFAGVAALRDLTEALEVLTMGRHMFSPTEFGGYTCKHCGGGPADKPHFRIVGGVEETAKTDIEKARAALAKAKGAA
jgi:hypothetical protein